MPQSLSGRTAGAEKGSAASGELRDFHTEICHHVHCLSLKEKKGLKIQVICWKRWLHLADFLNSDGVRYRFLSDPFFFYTNFTKSVSTRLHYLKNRDAPIAIFLADSNFRFFWKCDLPIQIFVNSDFLSKNYN